MTFKTTQLSDLGPIKMGFCAENLASMKVFACYLCASQSHMHIFFVFFAQSTKNADLEGKIESCGLSIS